MKRQNTLLPFHAGISIDGGSHAAVAWNLSTTEFLAQIPDRFITYVRTYWIGVTISLFGVRREFDFNFATCPFFHEIQFIDRNLATMHLQFAEFSEAIRKVLGTPTCEWMGFVRWHDASLVVDLKIRTVRNYPKGPSYPIFMFSFANTTQHALHWNNQEIRPVGLEVWG
ncbi:MAG: hypothetical protein WEB58_21695 [Planctomycetaceae bacterium]